LTIFLICRTGETAIATPHVAAANARAVTTAPRYRCRASDRSETVAVF
jgi:hypothetical protein